MFRRQYRLVGWDTNASGNGASAPAPTPLSPQSATPPVAPICRRPARCMKRADGECHRSFASQVLSRPRFYVQLQFQTNGVMSQYVLFADAGVLHHHARSYPRPAEKIRLSDVPPIALLDNVSRTGTFAGAPATSTAPGDAAQMVIRCVDAALGLSSEAANFLRRMDLGSRTLYSTAISSSEGEGAYAEQTAAETTSVTLEALSYDQFGRNLARKCGSIRIVPIRFSLTG
jgi:hypothetical protein